MRQFKLSIFRESHLRNRHHDHYNNAIELVKLSQETRVKRVFPCQYKMYVCVNLPEVDNVSLSRKKESASEWARGRKRECDLVNEWMRLLERKNDSIRRIIIIVVRISSRDLCDDGNDVEHDMITTMFFPPSVSPWQFSSRVRQDAISRRGF